MYIEFQLPNGAGGMAAGHAVSVIKKAIAEWAEQYNITYRTKIHKYTFRVCLESDEHYTLFELSWNPKRPYLYTYRLVTPGQ